MILLYVKAARGNPADHDYCCRGKGAASNEAAVNERITDFTRHAFRAAGVCVVELYFLHQAAPQSKFLRK
jgi:hypothetical protein